MSLEALKLKNISEKDQKMILEIDKMMGPEPDTMGFAKNLFWGRFQSQHVFPYPVSGPDENARCEQLLTELEAYLKTEHPSVQIDQDEFIPDWCIKRLFDIGVMGMTVPVEFGGLGLGITSYNRALELIGRHCGSTSVMVSAHQSIGCKAIMLFGTDEQKKYFLPKVAKEYLSAFCLSEPNVGSDAAGQETRCVPSEDGTHFILNGEKKWSTSGAMSGMFTVMANQKIRSDKTGQEKDLVTALICTPDMPGIDIYEKNRSKTGIRGTWQARIRFTDVRVPRENVLHKEGRGLQVALTCLNFGRCTLSAGVTGGAKQAMDQSIKWVQTRHQFDRALGEFELVQQRIAKMSAFTFVMDASLYLMTGMLDDGVEDIMVETAITKVLCSELGWEVIDDAMEIMGGEGYVVENELERIWRDNRIHRIVEGSNEVMQPFIFAYGGKQLAEQMMGIQEAVNWKGETSLSENVSRISRSLANPKILKRAVHLAAQLFVGYTPPAPKLPEVDERLAEYASRLSKLVQKHSKLFKLVSKWHRDQIVTRQATQARLANSAIYIFGLSASLSRMEHKLQQRNKGLKFDCDFTAFKHAFDVLEMRVLQNLGELRNNPDESMRSAAAAARALNDSLPNEDYYIHESSPTSKGTGKRIKTEHIRQFPGDSPTGANETASAGDGHVSEVKMPTDGKSIGRKPKSRKGQN